MENYLRNASRDGDVEKVKELLENGADVRSVDEYGQTALHWASVKGRTEVVELLLKYGSSINTLDMDGRTGLHLAAMWGHTETVKLLLPNHTNADGQDRYGWTPLHLSVIRGLTETVSTLLKNCCVDINVKDNEGKTALQKAKRFGHLDLIKMLESYEEEHGTPYTKRIKEDCDNKLSPAVARQALSAGSINLHLTRCVFVGPPGVGKTHIQNLVCELPLPTARSSTSLMGRPVITTIYCNGDEHNSRIVDSKTMLLFLSARVREILNKGTYTSLSILPCQPKMSELPHDSKAHSRPALKESSRLLHEKELLKCVSSLQMDPNEAIMTTNRMICLDSGGQPEFHRLLPTFVSNLDVAVCVLKLNEKLQDHPNIEWYHNGQPHGSSYSYCHTNEFILKRTIQGLTSMHNPPRLLFVGTHRDLEHVCDESIAEKNTRLKTILLPEFKKHLILYDTNSNDIVFPINSLSLESVDLMMVDKLKKEITRKYETISVKLTDLFLGLEVKALAEEKCHTLVRKDDCLKIGESLGLSPHEVDEAIHSLTKFNLLYYNDFLPDVVFCDLQSVLSNITHFVKKVHECHDQDPEWTALSKYGQFSEEMIKDCHGKSLFVDGLFSKHQFIQLLQHLGVISVIKTTPHKVYFMPSLLKEVNLSQLEYVKSCCIGHAQPIILFYEKGWPTTGTFCTLIARLLSRGDWKITEKDSSPVHLFSNCIQLSLQDHCIQGSCQVTIIDCAQYIELHVYISRITGVCDEVYDKMYRYICPKILCIIKHNMSNDTANGEVHATFMCPCSKPGTVMRNGTFKCSREDTITYLLSDRCKVWQEGI